jgi:hypothetical protein
MRGAWPFQLRLEAPVHQPMHRLGVGPLSNVIFMRK